MSVDRRKSALLHKGTLPPTDRRESWGTSLETADEECAVTKRKAKTDQAAAQRAFVAMRQHSYRAIICRCTGSIAPKTIPKAAFVTICGCLMRLLDEVTSSEDENGVVQVGGEHGNGIISRLQIHPSTYNPIGFGLAFLLVFRNNIAFQRFWQAQLRVGGVMSAVRTFASQLWYIDTAKTKYMEAKLHLDLLAFLFFETLRVQLNRDAAPTALYDDCGYLLTGLTDEELQTYHEHPRKAFLVLHWMRQELVLLRRGGAIDSFTVKMMDKSLRLMMDSAHGAITIATVGIPFPYLQLLDVALVCYCFLLPIIYVQSWGYALVMPVFFASAFLFGVNDVAAEIEMPYRYTVNNLPMVTYGKEVLSDLQVFEKTNSGFESRDTVHGSAVQPPPASTPAHDDDDDGVGGVGGRRGSGGGRRGSDGDGGASGKNRASSEPHTPAPRRSIHVTDDSGRPVHTGLPEMHARRASVRIKPATSLGHASDILADQLGTTAPELEERELRRDHTMRRLDMLAQRIRSGSDTTGYMEDAGRRQSLSDAGGAHAERQAGSTNPVIAAEAAHAPAGVGQKMEL